MKSLRLLGFVGGATVLCLAQMAANSNAGNLPNAEFRTGTDTPNGWMLSGGNGAWVDRELLTVHGTGTDSNYWRGDFEFTPGQLYRFEMRVRQRRGSGSVIAGPVFANRDYRVSPQWKWYSHVFRVPDNVGASYLRLGQWQATGTIEFDAVRLVPVLPVHQLHESGALGEGEAIRNGQYVFSGNYLHEGSNYHRVLERTSTSFNSSRWTFGDGAEVVYRFGDLGGQLESGSVSVNVNYYIRGQCVTEVSRDGTTWETVMTQTGLGGKTASLPSAVLPATDLRLRLRGVGGSFQVDRVGLSAAISKREDGVGRTEYAEVLQANPDLMVEGLTIRKGSAKGTAAILTVRTASPVKFNGQLSGSMTTSDGKTVNLPSARVLVDQEACVVEVPLVPAIVGSNRVDLMLAAPNRSALQIRFSLSVPDFYRSDYGARIAELGQQACVWWCDATRKIPRDRAAPQKTTAAASFAAARNDYEAVQVVVCPQEQLRGFTAEASALIGPRGAKIDAEEINVLRVAYHYVHTPTDATGVRDYWPDALPPLDQPLDLPGGLNQPLWVLTYVPPGTSPGDYRGHLTLKAEGYTQRIPLHLHVWDFELPKRNHLQTAFGLSAGNIFRYHQAKTDAEKRRVWDLYMQCFAEHRISPYSPTPLDPIGVKFLPDEDPPRAELDFSSFDPAMDRAVERFNVTGLRLAVPGMGGGTFHDRYEPSIKGFGEQTPQYKAMFSSYVSQLEEHLKQRGWLDLVYVYWFDEPAPRDYEFVRRGMKRLKQLAPGLTTMLTEQPEAALAGSVDIWCPVSDNYDHEAAKPFRADGDRFWWYVCTGPKAPYCTLFIDHGATELRVWLWQTWQRDISGILVWSSNYWTSTAAFPDPAQPQNPYADPMGYVSGYSTPKGTKRHWGNGDGRFIYPPLSAALPGASGPGAVIAAPVSSLRWEMLREGIEDYEYLSILRQQLRKRGDQLPESVRAEYESLLSVPETITKDITTFTKDASPIYQHRAAVARAIERLLQPE